MKRYETSFIEFVARGAGLEIAEVAPLVKTPDPEQGDLTFPCFSLAKRFRKNPAAIAAEIVERGDAPAELSSIAAAGPYINAVIDAPTLARETLEAVRGRGAQFLTGAVGEGRTVVIDYSSPNIAKPLGFHHLRSTVIGNALGRIHEALGYRVFGINFLGDWGKTFGLLAESFARFGDRDRLEREGIRYLLELYVEANAAAEADPGFDEAARAMFRRQEEGDPAALELWRRFRETSVAEFERLYARLGVSFDGIEGESRYRDGMAAVIERVGATVGTREDQGALVVDMEYDEGEPPMLLRKRDGATLYATRDIAAAIDRYERFEFAKSLYVVGVEQRRHFDQLRRAVAAMGFEWAERLHHVHFGRVQGMSTRRGKVVFLEEVLDEARDRAREKMAAATDGRELDIGTIAEQVGIGGVVFGDLKNLRTSDYKFDWEEILNPKGFTGVCCQYAHARCCSVLRKGGGVDAARIVTELLVAPEELTLLKDVARLPGAVEDAARALEPSRLARAIYEVARSWNRYQQAGGADRRLRVLCEDADLRATRLALVDAVRIGLSSSLALLGVPTPEAM